MVEETILQHWLFTKFLFPFALMFFLVYAILEKTKIFGDKSQQVNAMISAVISLIFVAAVYPKLVVENLVLFLTVALVVVFVGLLLWGFLSGSDAKLPFGTTTQKVAFAVIVIVVLVATLWATGYDGQVFNTLFRSSWSGSFWTNIVFVVMVIVMVAVIFKTAKGGK